MQTGSGPNVLDTVLGLLLVLVTLRGWRQGAVSQLAAFAGLALGLLVGVWAAPLIAGCSSTNRGRAPALGTHRLRGWASGQAHHFARCLCAFKRRPAGTPRPVAERRPGPRGARWQVSVPTRSARPSGSRWPSWIGAYRRTAETGQISPVALSINALRSSRASSGNTS
jgi:hypothetical protein